MWPPCLLAWFGLTRLGPRILPHPIIDSSSKTALRYISFNVIYTENNIEIAITSGEPHVLIKLSSAIL
jgi:hypothetical protein